MEKSFLSQLNLFHKIGNHCIPNIGDLYGALFTLSLHEYKYCFFSVKRALESSTIFDRGNYFIRKSLWKGPYQWIPDFQDFDFRGIFRPCFIFLSGFHHVKIAFYPLFFIAQNHLIQIRIKKREFLRGKIRKKRKIDTWVENYPENQTLVDQRDNGITKIFSISRICLIVGCFDNNPICSLSNEFNTMISRTDDEWVTPYGLNFWSLGTLIHISVYKCVGVNCVGVFN